MKLQEHNETMVTRCYKQSNLLTRKYLGSTLTLMKISKLLAASRKSFVATKWGLLSQMLCAAFSQQERPESRLTSLSRLPQA